MPLIYKDELWAKISIENIDKDEDLWVSNYGRLKSYKTSRNGGKIIGGSWLTGYNIIVIKISEGKKKTIFVHKLVAEYFLDKVDAKSVYVVHIDHDKSNNHYSNLKLVNREGLQLHRLEDENYHKKKVRNFKLNEDIVRELRLRLKNEDIRPYRLAQEYGITHTQLNRIKNNENWKHVVVD